jgi:DNA-binding XRE family transcriptional regulator
VTETNVFQLSQPGTFADPLTEVLRNGARALLTQAVEAEVAALLSCHADKLTDDGRQRLVRHGHLPERKIVTGIGPVAVRCPRVRDRAGEGSERIRFSSAILPPYAEMLLPGFRRGCLDETSKQLIIETRAPICPRRRRTGSSPLAGDGGRRSRVLSHPEKAPRQSAASLSNRPRRDLFREGPGSPDGVRATGLDGRQKSRPGQPYEDRRAVFMRFTLGSFRRSRRRHRGWAGSRGLSQSPSAQRVRMRRLMLVMS